MIKCDKAMRRSKEKCFTPLWTRWKCSGDCTTCMCGMKKDSDGVYHHNTYVKAHKKKENTND